MSGLLARFFEPPVPQTATIQPWNRTIAVGPRQTLLEAALAHNLLFPHNCTIGTCHTCKCRLLSGSSEVIGQSRGRNTRRSPASSPWQGRRLVTAQLARHLQSQHPGLQAYMCGPPPMIDAGITELVNLGVDFEAIRYDKFTDASLGKS